MLLAMEMPGLRYRMLAGMALVLALCAAACSSTEGSEEAGKDVRHTIESLPANKPVRLTVWGFPESNEFKGVMACVEEFDRRHPEIEVVVGAAGGQVLVDPQKLMTAIAAGTPPDLIWQDRFTISGWASRGAFRAIDDLVERDRIDPGDFYPACWNEATYQRKLYGLPTDTDCRGLYYNRQLFRDAGLDPDRLPQNWNELLDYALKLTKKRRGYLEQIGFAPNYGNTWLYLYGWLNGGEFMSADGQRCTLNDPRIVEALDWMTRFYDALGGRAEVVAGFERGAGIGIATDPFVTGKLAMIIDGNWALDNIARYRPNLDFAVAPPPPPEGKKPLTWSGGFAMVIPRGAKHVEEAWKLAKWLTSLEGRICEGDAQTRYNASVGKPFYIPRLTARRSVNNVIFQHFPPPNENTRQAIQTFLELMEVSRYRPVTPVGQMLWDEQARAIDNATFHVMSAQDALNLATRRVQEELDRIIHPKPYPPLNWNVVLMIAFLLIIVILFFCIRAAVLIKRRNRMYRQEAFAGLLFVSPWCIGFLVLWAGPMFISMVFSFCQYDVLHPARFVGLHNFIKMIGFHRSLSDGASIVSANDLFFWKSLWNTLYITVIGVPLGMIIGLAIAMLLNTEIRGIAVYRTLYYLPAIVPIVATAILWLWLLNPQVGIVAIAFRGIGVPSPNWFWSQKWAKLALILMLLWQSGSSMVIWLAGLKGIPRHLYEAADIDGSNWWNKFRHITLPMLSPYIFFNLIIGTIGYFQIFTQAYVVSNPPTAGPADSLLFFVYYLFNNAFSYFKMGYASALAWVLFAIIFALTLLQIKLAPKWVFYEGEEPRP